MQENVINSHATYLQGKNIVFNKGTFRNHMTNESTTGDWHKTITSSMYACA